MAFIRQLESFIVAMAQNSFYQCSQLKCLHSVSQEQQEKISRLEKEQEDARSDIKVSDNFTTKCVVLRAPREVGGSTLGGVRCLSTQGYNWVCRLLGRVTWPAEVSCTGLAFRPGGGNSGPNHYMLRKPEISARPDGPLGSVVCRLYLLPYAVTRYM